MRERRIVGLDLDGVMFNFTRPYHRLFREYTGRDLFQSGDDDAPPTWHTPQLRGYRADEVAAVWKAITSSTTFWERLDPLPGLYELGTVPVRHDTYFVTSRPGRDAKRQTERALEDALGYIGHTVCVVPARRDDRPVKGLLAHGLGLHVYIDDNLDNVKDAAEMAPGCKVYLLDRSYNRSEDPVGVTRVGSVREMIEREQL